MSDQIRQQITDRILKALAEGLVPWGRPWLGHRNDGPATNALTSLPFRGVNPLLLNLAGFSSKWWATAKVWKAFGFRLKPYQQGTHVFTGQADDLQCQVVFNAQQVNGPGVGTQAVYYRLPRENCGPAGVRRSCAPRSASRSTTARKGTPCSSAPGCS